jgi:hypothetical protein
MRSLGDDDASSTVSYRSGPAGLAPAPARHIVLTDPEASNSFLWADQSLQELYGDIKNTPNRKQLADMLVVRQLAAEFDAEARATIRPTSCSARFYALLQRLNTMLDIVKDSWHVASLRLHITNRNEMLDGRLLLDEDDTTRMLCTDNMRTLVSDRLQKNAELTTRKFTGSHLAFVIEGSQTAVLRARDFVDKTLCRAGLHWHPSKGQFQVPSQGLHDHLGYEVNIPRNLLRVPERRCHTIRRLEMALRGEAARNRRLVPTRLLQQFTGTACSTSLAVRNARFHLRSLYDCTVLTRPHSRLSRTALQDFDVWAHFQYDSQLNGIPLFTSPTSRALYTDASGGVGWGGVLPPLPVQERLCRSYAAAPHETSTALHHYAGVELPAALWRTSANEAGLWDADLLPLHINFKELCAVHRSLLACRSDLQGHSVLLFCDNTTVVQLLRKGTSRSPLLMEELRQVCRLLIDMQVDLVPVYIPSVDNPADFPSRHSQSTE